MSARNVLRRGSALLLAGLFLAGELGWSGIDALAFHTDVAHHAGSRGVAAPGAAGASGLTLLTAPTSTGDHAAHCVLGLTTGSARASVSAALQIRLEPAVTLRSDATSCAPGLRTDPGTLALPRAPPAPTA